MAALKRFNLKNLNLLEGGLIEAAFDEHLEKVGRDLENRPGDQTARTIVMKISIVPVIVKKDCDEAKVTVTMKSTVPDHKTQEISCGLRKDGMLVFREHSEEDVNQNNFLAETEDDS